MSVFTYLIIVILCCIELFLHYKFINFLNPNLTEKQRSYILSVKSSLTFILLGIYYNYYYFTSNLDETTFYNTLEEYNHFNLGKIAILYFLSYCIMDLSIGIFDYRSHLDMLSACIHHVVYIFITILSIYTGFYPILLLHMLSEIPTFILGLGCIDEKYRNNMLFGMSFFSFRIFYHAILIYVFRHYSVVFYIGSAAWLLHVYWFYGWFNKYGYPLIDKSKKKTKTKKIKIKIV